MTDPGAPSLRMQVATVSPTHIRTGMFEGARAMLLTPILTPEHGTARVWTAMKAGRKRLFPPWSVYLSNSYRGLLPLVVYDWLATHVIGIYSFTTHFKGSDR